MNAAPLSAEERELLLLLELERGADSLLDFVPRINPRHSRPSHLAPIAALLARAAHGEEVRALVSCPPRHGKTETLLVHGVPWYLSMFPHHHVAYVTYGDELARDKSAKARDVARWVGLPLREDSKSKTHWLTPHDGGLFATGIGGPLTGHGFELMIVDDPHKNREEAESPTQRETVHEWFSSTFMSRLEVGGSVIVTHQRWHDDDLIGRLSRDKEVPWEVVNLPAIAIEGRPDPLGRSPGEALWPERWPLRALDVRRRESGAYNWASMFQGEPRPRGGRVFGGDVHWFRLDQFAIEGKRIAICADPAASEKTSADFSSAVVLAVEGHGVDQRAWVIDVLREQITVPQFVRRLGALQAKHRVPLVVESVGGFKAIPQLLRELDPNLEVVELLPRGDKFTRAQGVAAAWNDGRVLIPQDAPWTQDFLAEVQAFTGVKDVHDDQVDALSGAWNHASSEPAIMAAVFSSQPSWVTGAGG